ncbi:hypothetical protein BDL97_05G007600 [Sphagnum fallax]|nr:hypothetical protein BDL97_05G007600 [Sphagnum fallax]KAH8960659.1 hypothetical protein BDL97_05G007600 [Sphagnum fallax]
MSKVTRARKSCTVLTDKTNEPSTPSTMAKVGNRNSLEAVNPGSKHCLEASSAVIPAEMVCNVLEPQCGLEAAAANRLSAQLDHSAVQSYSGFSSPNITKFLSKWVGIDVQEVGHFDEEDENDALPDSDPSDQLLCAGKLPSCVLMSSMGADPVQ